jgi:large subunit ribosomal protein L22
MAVKAVGRQVGISSKRVRPFLRAVMGMHVNDAIESLRFQPGATAEKVAELLRSAAANAENNNNMDPTRLRVVGGYANQAVAIRRFRARSRGRVGHVRRPASHITVLVDVKE